MANYYNNDEVQAKVEEYLLIDKEIRKTDLRANRLRQEILKEVAKIINGEIFTHKFTIWENYDDLFQEGMEACIRALEKFNPNFITSKGVKATTFNYFSLTAKRCMKFYTIRNKNFRNNPQIDDFLENITVSRNIVDDTVQQTVELFISQLRETMKEKENVKFLPLVDILENYLNKMGSYNKRDFFRFSKSYGWSPNLIRKFLKLIKTRKDVFYADYEEVDGIKIDLTSNSRSGYFDSDN